MVDRIPMIKNADVNELCRIIEDRSGENYPDISSHLISWSRNKYNLYKLFGEKLTIEREIDCLIGDSDMYKLLEEFCDVMCTNRPQTILIEYFLKHAVIPVNDFKVNTLSVDVSVLEQTFKKGMKISRILPKLTTRDFADTIQIEYSKVLQKIKASGKVVLSIDPKDFLTMSESTNGWRSCQALDGEYRTGTLALMMDCSTVVAYTTTGQIVKNRFTIENKNWRQLVFFSVNSRASILAIQGRQYPSTNLIAEQTVSDMLIELLGKDSFHRVDSTTAEINEYEIVRNTEYGLEDSQLWYNDILRESFTECQVIIPTAFHSLNDMINFANWEPIWIGNDCVECCCGCGSLLEDGGSFFAHGEDFDDEYGDEDDE